MLSQLHAGLLLCGSRQGLYICIIPDICRLIGIRLSRPLQMLNALCDVIEGIMARSRLVRSGQMLLRMTHDTVKLRLHHFTKMAGS